MEENRLLSSWNILNTKNNTCTEITKVSKRNTDTIVDTINYRGYSINIYLDEYGQCYYCVFENEYISFSTFDYTNYKEDIKYLIDTKLDTIHIFEGIYSKVKLKWFNNGNFRDIVLLNDNRIIKIFLTNKSFVLTEKEKEKLISLSLEILEKYFKKLN